MNELHFNYSIFPLLLFLLTAYMLLLSLLLLLYLQFGFTILAIQIKHFSYFFYFYFLCSLLTYKTYNNIMRSWSRLTHRWHTFFKLHQYNMTFSFLLFVALTQLGYDIFLFVSFKSCLSSILLLDSSLSLLPCFYCAHNCNFIKF